VQETGRHQFNLFRGQENAMGLSEFDKMKQSVPISRDPRAHEMVERVGRRIASVANLPGAQWEFVVFESPEANAFCLPGGKVGVYTGILPICRDDAGLAVVLGHEVSHAYAHHGGERMTEALGLQLAGELALAEIGSSKYAQLAPVFQQAYGIGSQLGVALPHSRAQESEADHIGLLFMARAGYDPANAVAFWQRFAEFNKRQGGAVPWYLRTHPTDDRRIADLQKLQPEASAQYRPR
jgi:metalloendopeptidase OMA1, mitochondrial